MHSSQIKMLIATQRFLFGNLVKMLIIKSLTFRFFIEDRRGVINISPKRMKRLIKKQRS